jgi:TRAP transporter TAXI family solute receptor
MWYRACSALVAALVMLSLCGTIPAQAQSIPRSLQGGDTEAALRERKNAWTVGLVGGLMEGTYMRLADDLRKALDDEEDQMRLLPIVSRGVAANVEDLLYLRNVDVAVTQADVFEYFRTVRKIPNIENRINYVTTFPLAEVHIITRAEIKTLEDLRGKRVHFASAGSSGSLTGPIIFQRLGIEVQAVMDDIPNGNERLKNGQLDALVRVVGKPVPHVAAIPSNLGFHMLSIPYSKKFSDYYTIGEITNKDYPNLVQPDERVETLAVPGMLAVYNWPKGSDRYRRVERFVQRLFANWQKLQKPPYHPKWKDVNFAATVTGWNRFPVAEREVERLKEGSGAVSQAELGRDFQAFLSNLGGQGAPRNQSERDAMFREFLEWRQKQGSR